MATLDIPLLPENDDDLLADGINELKQTTKDVWKDATDIFKGMLDAIVSNGKTAVEQASQINTWLKDEVFLNKKARQAMGLVDEKKKFVIQNKIADGILSVAGYMETLTTETIGMKDSMSSWFKENLKMPQIISDDLKASFSLLGDQFSTIAKSFLPKFVTDYFKKENKNEKDIEKERKGFLKLFKMKYFEKSLKALTGILASAGNFLTDLIIGFLALAIFDPNGTLMASILGFLVDIGLMLLNMIIGLLPKVIAIIPPIIAKLAEAFLKIVPVLVTAIVKLVPLLVQVAITLISTIIAMLPTVIGALLDGVMQILPALISGFFALLPKLITGILKLIPMLIQFVIDYLPSMILMIVDAVVQALPVIITAIVDNLPMIIEKLVELFFVLVPVLIEAMFKIGAALVRSFPKLFMAVQKSMLLAIVKLTRGIMDLFKKLTSFILQSTGIGQLIDRLIGFIKSIANIGNTIGEAFRSSTIVQGFLDLFKKVLDLVGLGRFLPGNKEGEQAKENLLRGTSEYDSFNSIKDISSGVKEANKRDDAAIALAYRKASQKEYSELDPETKATFATIAKGIAKKQGETITEAQAEIKGKELAEGLKGANKDVVDLLQKIYNDSKGNGNDAIFALDNNKLSIKGK